MAGSLKDALEKSGVVEKKAEPPPQDHRKWKNDLPTDHPPYIPFEAPALTKPGERTKKP